MKITLEISERELLQIIRASENEIPRHQTRSIDSLLTESDLYRSEFDVSLKNDLSNLLNF